MGEIRKVIKRKTDAGKSGSKKPIRGTWKPGQKPSDFGGIWTDDGRTAESIREQAWGRKF